MKWKGGPHPQSVVEYYVSDSSVATVTDTGLVRGVTAGMVKIRGTLQTVRQDTGALLTLAQVGFRSVGGIIKLTTWLMDIR